MCKISALTFIIHFGADEVIGMPLPHISIYTIGCVYKVWSGKIVYSTIKYHVMYGKRETLNTLLLCVSEMQTQEHEMENIL